eukprot:10412958-Alexandrium_andersonii.AAC.1
MAALQQPPAGRSLVGRDGRSHHHAEQSGLAHGTVVLPADRFDQPDCTTYPPNPAGCRPGDQFAG